MRLWLRAVFRCPKDLLPHLHVSEGSWCRRKPRGALLQRDSRNGRFASAHSRAFTCCVYTGYSSEPSSFMKRRQRASSQESYLQPWHLRYRTCAEVKEAGEGPLVWRASLILLAEKRRRLCREMRRMTAAAQPGLDTARGHGEVVSRSSAVIKALFHTWHLRKRRLLTPCTFLRILLWCVANAGWIPGPRGKRTAVWQRFKGQTHPWGTTVNLGTRDGHRGEEGVKKKKKRSLLHFRFTVQRFKSIAKSCKKSRKQTLSLAWANLPIKHSASDLGACNLGVISLH